MDELSVRVERRAGVAVDEGAAAGQQLAALVKALIGVTASVDVAGPGGIERSQGKMRRIVDERPPR